MEGLMADRKLHGLIDTFAGSVEVVSFDESSGGSTMQRFGRRWLLRHHVSSDASVLQTGAAQVFLVIRYSF
jgi:hypothetical protein